MLVQNIQQNLPKDQHLTTISPQQQNSYDYSSILSNTALNRFPRHPKKTISPALSNLLSSTTIPCPKNKHRIKSRTNSSSSLSSAKSISNNNNRSDDAIFSSLSSTSSLSSSISSRRSSDSSSCSLQSSIPSKQHLKKSHSHNKSNKPNLNSINNTNKDNTTTTIKKINPNVNKPNHKKLSSLSIMFNNEVEDALMMAMVDDLIDELSDVDADEEDDDDDNYFSLSLTSSNNNNSSNSNNNNNNHPRSLSMPSSSPTTTSSSKQSISRRPSVLLLRPGVRVASTSGEIVFSSVDSKSHPLACDDEDEDSGDESSNISSLDDSFNTTNDTIKEGKSLSSKKVVRSFVSNLTASLKAISNVASSLSASHQTTILHSTDVFKFSPRSTDEPIPSVKGRFVVANKYDSNKKASSSEPTNKSSDGKKEVVTNDKVEKKQDKTKQQQQQQQSQQQQPILETKEIPMETYNVQEYTLPPSPRGRDYRDNSDFLRVYALETLMKLHGKFDANFAGRAQVALLPRKDDVPPPACGSMAYDAVRKSPFAHSYKYLYTANHGKIVTPYCASNKTTTTSTSSSNKSSSSLSSYNDNNNNNSINNNNNNSDIIIKHSNPTTLKIASSLTTDSNNSIITTEQSEQVNNNNISSLYNNNNINNIKTDNNVLITRRVPSRWIPLNIDDC